MRPSLTLTTPVRRRAAAAAAVVALAGLVACTPRAGSAAIVGDTRITTEDVQADSRELLALADELGAPQVQTADLNRRQVTRLVTDALIREAAERRGVTVSQAEVDTLIRESAAGVGRDRLAQQVAVNEGVPVSGFESFAEVIQLNQQLLDVVAPGQDVDSASAVLLAELAALSDELGVTVNPRYGTWDASSLSVDLPPNDLSTRADQPAPVVTAGELITD